MKVKCEYCGAMIEDNQASCPNCGATNVNIKRTVDNTPKTIEELKKWYSDRNLPPYETTRFFIGIDYQNPRAFGIYKDGSEFVVYKNKDDGSRAIRYRGTDEAYAVNEIWLKLKSEILNQKARNVSHYGRSSRWGQTRKGNAFSDRVFWGFLIGFIILYIITKPRPTYYRYDGDVFCKYNNSYYKYDYEIDDYYYIDEYSIPDPITEDGDEYKFDGKDSDWDSNYSFTNSNYYEEHFDSSDSSSSDSSYDWGGSDSWDSGGSDWSSDW